MVFIGCLLNNGQVGDGINRGTCDSGEVCFDDGSCGGANN